VLVSVYLIGAWLRRRERLPRPETVGLLLVAGWAAIDSQRLLNFLLLVLAVYGAAEYGAVASALGSRLSATYRIASRHVAGALALVLSATLAVVVSRGLADFARAGLGYAPYPVGAVEWLERHGAGGRLLTHFNHGSYAIWRLYPLYQVAIDGRYEETYPQETIEAAWIALQPTAPGHAEALRQIAPDYILVPDAAWARDFGADWRIVYEDAGSVVLSRPSLPVDANRAVRPAWTPGF